MARALRRLFLACIAGIALAATSAADAQVYMLQMPAVTANVGESFTIPVEGDWIEPVKGFQLSIQIPIDAPFAELSVSIDSSLVGQLEPDFAQFTIGTGSITGGVLLETIPPFQGTNLPSVGFPLLLAEIHGTIPAGASEGVFPIVFADGLGSPPVNNTFVVEFASVPPSLFLDGLVDVVIPPPPEIFIRGDVNSDGLVDLGDAIFHLNYTFAGGAAPVCLDAGDANDDGASDISDAIFLLSYLFDGGPTMNPPFPNPGIDYTPDAIDCATPPDLP
ncbi:MAG: dockerin type I domain-containing protein [Planctomycetota bacterium]